jgi:hypothetical protein
VFFNDTCTSTEPVYLNVTGVLQLPQGEFRESELQQILLDSFSAYLNFSKEFITIIIRQIANDTSSGTGENLTNMSTSADVNASIAPQNTSNSTYGRRRLLYDLTVERFFTALFQIGLNDNPTYVKIQNFINDTQNDITSITNANGYRIVVKQADLTPGYFNAAGTALRKCDDGEYPIADSLTQKLECKAKIIVEVVVEVVQQTSGYWVAMAVAVLVLVVIICIHYRRKGRETLPARYETLPQNGELQRYCGQEFGVHISKLQVPATVAIEYRLLPGQSI